MIDGLLSHSAEEEHANVACSVICYPSLSLSLSLWLSHPHSLVLQAGEGPC